jgi:hypothetical protein
MHCTGASQTAPGGVTPGDRGFPPHRHVQPRGVFTRENRRARGRADGHCVGLSETNSLAREPVKVRRLDQIGAITSEVRPTEIVGEDEDDVGSGSWVHLCCQRAQARQQQATEMEQTKP